MYWLPKKIVWLRHYTPHHPLCEDFYTTAGSIFYFKRGLQPPKASRGSFDNEESSCSAPPIMEALQPLHSISHSQCNSNIQDEGVLADFYCTNTMDVIIKWTSSYKQTSKCKIVEEFCICKFNIN